MRLVEIKNIEYAEYNRIRNILMQKIQFAIINEQYSAELKQASFMFWDSDYIPAPLKQFIVSINQKLVKECDELIGEVKLCQK
jgi:hypothetical protein